MTLFLGVVRSVANLLARSLPMSGRIEKKNRSIVVVVETIKQKRLESGLQMAKKIMIFKKNYLFLGLVRSVANLLARSLPMSGRIEKKIEA